MSRTDSTCKSINMYRSVSLRDHPLLLAFDVFGSCRAVVWMACCYAPFSSKCITLNKHAIQQLLLEF